VVTVKTQILAPSKNANARKGIGGLTYAGSVSPNATTGESSGQKQSATYADVGFQPGRGKGNWKPGSGPGGNCICPSCGQKIPHEQGMPCRSVKCPNCGNFMIREGIATETGKEAMT
jgi:predicted RNA-binding Zn-ribbon protein involved in translation (DUF1610 family)